MGQLGAIGTSAHCERGTAADRVLEVASQIRRGESQSFHTFSEPLG
jgi:hypothetical protein